jgi:hypothetical protein
MITSRNQYNLRRLSKWDAMMIFTDAAVDAVLLLSA